MKIYTYVYVIDKNTVLIDATILPTDGKCEQHLFSGINTGEFITLYEMKI